MNLLEPDDVPLTVHEDIINYLKEQDLFYGEDEDFAQNITNFTETQIKEILEMLLQKFERNQKLKEDYEARVLAHNQHTLFKLPNILPDFEISDEMFDALTFRETLIINRVVDDTETVSVGGLCLDIQEAPAKPPRERRDCNINSRLTRIFGTDENTDVVQMDDITGPDDKQAEAAQEEMPDLEDSLEVQANRCLSKFLVHLSSQFDLDGYNAGSTITSWVDKNLHTLEEARQEFYTKEVKPSEASAELKKEFSNKVSKSGEQLSRGKSVDKDSSQKSPRKSIEKDHSKSRSGKLSKSDQMHRQLSKASSRGSKASNSRLRKGSVRKSDQALGEHSHGRTSKSQSKRPSRVQSRSSSKQGRMSSTECAKSQSRASKSVSERVHHLEDNEIPDKADETAGDEINVTTKVIEKKLYVGLFKKFYYIKHTSNEDKIDNRKFYSLRKTRDYISEGANFILQRYLAKTIYIGSFEMSTMYINGDMCRNIYNCPGPESQVINNRKIDVCTIYRTIVEECGIEHKCTTVLTLQGQIIHQKWEGTDYTLQINPLLDLTNYRPVANEQLLVKHAWESDMQLMSKYLDTKIENDIKIKSYMIDHPEFRNMITDYIHTILQLKPEDIIEFTISHFLSFAPQYLPQNDYFPNY